MVSLQEIPIYIIVVAYAFSFVIIGVQVTLADPMDIEMKIYDEVLGGFGNQNPTGCYNSVGGVVGGELTPTYSTESACISAGFEWSVASQSFKSAIEEMTDEYEGCYDVNDSLIGGVNNVTYTTQLECTYASAITTNPAIPYTWEIGTGGSYSTLSGQTNEMRLTMTDEISVTSNPITSAGAIIYQLFGIVTGTYIFNVLLFFNVPYIFVAGIIMVYIMLLAYTVIKLLRP